MLLASGRLSYLSETINSAQKMKNSREKKAAVRCEELVLQSLQKQGCVYWVWSESGYRILHTKDK